MTQKKELDSDVEMFLIRYHHSSSSWKHMPSTKPSGYFIYSGIAFILALFSCSDTGKYQQSQISSPTNQSLWWDGFWRKRSTKPPAVSGLDVCVCAPVRVTSANWVQTPAWRLLYPTVFWKDKKKCQLLKTLRLKFQQKKKKKRKKERCALMEMDQERLNWLWCI